MATKTYAHLDGAASDKSRAVRELIPLDAALVPGEDVFTPDFAADMVDVTAVSPAPEVGWTTADGGKTFAAPVPPEPKPAVRSASGYALLMALTDDQRGLYNGLKPWDQRRLSARTTPWPEDNDLVARVAPQLKTTPKAWFDAALDQI